MREDAAAAAADYDDVTIKSLFVIFFQSLRKCGE
jgi:hypothetical protein